MNRKIIIIIILTIFISYQIFNKPNIKPLIENVENISRIVLYYSETDSIIKIEDKSEIKDKVTKWSKIIVKKDRLALNNKDHYIVVSTYDADGETVETFYTSREGIEQYHWKLQIIEGKNPYYELQGM